MHRLWPTALDPNFHVIIFENLRFRPSTRIRSISVFKNLYSLKGVFKNLRICGRKRRLPVDGRCKRRKKLPFSKISGYVWQKHFTHKCSILCQAALVRMDATLNVLLSVAQCIFPFKRDVLCVTIIPPHLLQYYEVKKCRRCFHGNHVVRS